MANWQLLEKTLRKRGQDKLLGDWSGVKDSKDGAAVELLVRMFTGLTGKEVAVAPPRPSIVEPPPYSRTTAARALAQTADSDLEAKEAVLEEHREHLLHDKMTDDPDRYRPRPAPARTQARQLEVARETAPIQFKEVTVRPLDKNQLAALRGGGGGGSRLDNTQTAMSMVSQGPADGYAARSRAATGISMRSAGVASHQSSSNNNNNIHNNGNSILGGGGSGSGSGSGVLEVLNQAVVTHLQGSEQALNSLQAGGREVFVGLTESVARLPGEQVAGVLEEACKRKDLLAEMVMTQPGEMWRLFSLLSPLLETGETSLPFGALIDLYVEVGAACVGQDPTAAWGLFQDFCLPRVCELVRLHPAKRYDLLRIVYNFCRNDVATHVVVIKKLKDVLNDRDIFVHCLTMTIFLENLFTEDLLDLYVYYCAVGLSLPKPSLRAAALSMLTVVVDESHQIVLSMLDRLEALASDEWWEVRAQLLLVCSYLLEHLGGSAEQGSADEKQGQGSRVRALAAKVLLSSSNPNILKVGLSYLARNLRAHPALARPYLTALCTAPETLRNSLLGPAEQVQGVEVMGRVVGSYSIISVPTAWPGLLVAVALGSLVKEQGLAALEPRHALILAAAVRSSVREDASHLPGREGWAKVFTELKDYIYVALCDDEIADTAAQIIRDVFAAVGTPVFATLPTFASVLQMLFPDGIHKCQQTAQDLITDLFKLGPPFDRAITQTLSGLPQSTINNTALKGVFGYVTSKQT